MSQGCHLIFSGEDKEHFNYHRRPQRNDENLKHTVLKELGLPKEEVDSQIISVAGNNALVINHGLAGMRGIEQDHIDTFEKRYKALPEEDKQAISHIVKEYKAVQADLISGLGNSMLDVQYARALPQAISNILRHTSNSMGLFNRARAGASSWISTLKNTASGKANGVAYEVLMANRLLKTKIRNSSGKTLRITSKDRVDFGLKQQASYMQKSSIFVTDGFESFIFDQPNRLTVEADLLIHKEDGIVGVDFKHSSVGGESNISSIQLDGIYTALETGEVDEFHFISNTSFNSKTIDRVKEINDKIERHNEEVRTGEIEFGEQIKKIELFQNCGWE